MAVVFCDQRDSARCEGRCVRVPQGATTLDLPSADSEIVATAKYQNNHHFLERLPIRAGLIFSIITLAWILLTETAYTAAAPHDDPRTLLPLLTRLIFPIVGGFLMHFLLKWSLGRTLADQLDAQSNAERLSLALTATNSGAWEWHFPTRKFYLSEQMAALVGSEENTHRTWASLMERIHPEDRSKFGNVICQTLQAPDQEHWAQYRIQRSDNTYRWFEVRGRIVLDAKGKPERVVGVGTDITNIKEKDSRIERLTYFDTLTGLPNRAKFMSTLNGKLEQRKGTDTVLLVARLDINRFQDINNVYGTAFGDQILTILGHRLEFVSGRRGIVSRFAGDDFAIAVSSLGNEDAAQDVAKRISQAANQPIELDGETIILSSAMGATICPNDGDAAEKLLSYAELALVQARDDGQTLSFYEPGMNEVFRERAYMEQELATALRADRLTLDYQPVVRATDQSLVGFEALVRWFHPKLGMVSPAQFVPLAETTGLIGELGHFVLRTACTQAAIWNRSSPGPIMIAVNVSARQMDDDSFVEEVAAVLAETGLPPACLELEVTESIIMSDFQPIRARLQRLRDLGVSVAVDDFGTGYSSLAVLKQLPVSKLKIDRSFVQDLNASEEGDAIVAAILELAQSMNLAVTAEGVETPEQLEFLRARKCQTIQGYLISKPLPPESLQPFLAECAAA